MSADTDPEKMDLLAKSTLKPVYPVIARQIIASAAIEKGVCLDIGSGPAPLAIAMAKISGLDIYAMDISRRMNRIARNNVAEECLAGRIAALAGDVHNMPFADNSVDLVISRGSIFFWDDKVKAFKEIYRVLKPYGFGYVGGGMGDARLKAIIAREFAANANKTGDPLKKKIDAGDLNTALATAKIPDFEIIDDASGIWAIIKKP